ncbi:uncharacterized protein LOC115695144 [Cannabis sativa]|uniref:uncharacterized protein LOC115695144 n=1 Tax=Cannabis sativa TaxID=3483 RepID=UPI0011E01E83|nr:uncharacterized protein LOC115695144 [Cannabis sativa]
MLHGLQFPVPFVKLIIQCISTPRFSLMFNGTLHGFFESKRGLRQGDPISPLLFVIGVEYLSRLIGKVRDKEDFCFHDRCTELKLNHLTFADGVILFSKRDERSVSNMEQSVVERLLKLSGFSRQNLPFTYLGIPINVRRISGKECEILIEKMTTRIRSWSSRNLSFAGRIVLINSVLMAIQAYWSQILILPKKIIKGIEAVCRAFLWKGQSMFRGLEQSIGTRQSQIARSLLWMKWIQSVYLKKGDWWSYTPSIHASWYWKKLVALKDQVRSLIDTREFAAHKFSITAGYKILTPSLTKSYWSKEVWARLNLPKHCFILWLAMHGRLKTKDRLSRMGIQVRSESLPNIIRWIGKSKISRGKKQILASATASLVYHLWTTRNVVIWKGEQAAIGRVNVEIKEKLKMRLTMFQPQKIGRQDKEWIQSL